LPLLMMLVLLLLHVAAEVRGVLYGGVVQASTRLLLLLLLLLLQVAAELRGVLSGGVVQASAGKPTGQQMQR
jgi:hypothetical protein